MSDETESNDAFFDFVEPDIIKNHLYCSNKRGKNWCGILKGKNSVNMQMDFLKCNGSRIDTSKLRAGMAIEIGGDYVSGDGVRHPNREQYVIQHIYEGKGILMKKYSSRAEAMKNRFKEGEYE